MLVINYLKNAYNMYMKKILALTIVGIIVVGGVSFYGGMQYQISKVQSNVSQMRSQFSRGVNGTFAGGGGGTRNAGMQRGGGMISGEVISKDDSSVTVKLSDGGSKNIFFSSSTKILKSSEGTLGDIGIGKQIFGQGTVNTDGSVTAETIQLR